MIDAYRILSQSGFSKMAVYPSSVSEERGAIYFLARHGNEKKLCLVVPENSKGLLSGFGGAEHKPVVDGKPVCLKICPLTHENAIAMRSALPSTASVACGARGSIGIGDRLGIATPAHVRALRGSNLFPFLAQQSIREMNRTGRNPEDVIDDTSWGVFQEGWKEGFGSDADHLKATHDIDRCIRAGFNMFTVDPGDYVDNKADSDSPDTLRQKVEKLPWDLLRTKAAELESIYMSKPFTLSDSSTLTFSTADILRAASKYGRAIAHTVEMYRHLVKEIGNRQFEFEVSVDETMTPTSVAEHFFIAKELKRLGVKWVSLAPRFIGRFEKGVDYIGDLREFETKFKKHLAVADYFGSYKISIHSGSDKFVIYPVVSGYGAGRVHLKTSGTTYLEALRTVAAANPSLFREILGFSVGCYNTDRASYHVSADIRNIPLYAELPDTQLLDLLDKHDTRQVLHVTYGSLLTSKTSEGRYRFRDRILGTLVENEELHYGFVEKHIRRHVEPFVQK
jgi:hypothetical protein